jgi:prolyl-tRNA synthetase
MAISESGEDEIIYCDCGYAANADKAKSIKSPAAGGKPLPLEEVATPGFHTILEVSDFLKVPRSQALKAVFYVADGELIFVVIRGDLEVNEVKLKNTLGSANLRLAREDEVRQAGIVAGSASAIGLDGIKVVADESVTSGTNFIAGANKPDTHFKNVNYPRDFEASLVADIALAGAGDGCPGCGGRLSSTHGIEVGHIFKLGTFLSEKLGAGYIDASGASRPIVMGCYGIGIGRLMATAIELNHDDKGIIWPPSIAPYQVYLCPLYLEEPEVLEAAEKLYAGLEAQGVEVLFDDRSDSPGVKFNDADLLGIPLRVTISPRTLEKKSVELKWRPEKKPELVPIDEAVAKIKGLIRG